MHARNQPPSGRRTLPKDLVKSLTKLLGRDNVLSSQKHLLAYSYDATQHLMPPDLVVFPHDARQVSEIVGLAHRYHIPLVPRGAGTGISGGTVPVQGGIVVALSRMNRILSIDTESRLAVVEPGVTNLELQEALAPLGFFYPPDPASQKSCTIGGNVAENAGGPLCFRYGVTSRYVRAIEVVLPDGEIVNLGAAVEDAPGYDLRGLFIGSEGTLGIATRITVQILPLPESSRTLLAVFDRLDDAGRTASDIISLGIVPDALELMDRPMCQSIEQSLRAGYPTDAEGVLLIEIAGHSATLDAQLEEISQVCRRNSARELRIAADRSERDVLWKGRKGAFGSVARICPAYLVNDGTVPRSRLVEALRQVGRIAEEHHVQIANVAHAGDGNLHPLILFDDTSIAERTAAKEAAEAILDACIALGGTISGEHGIGLEKLHAMGRCFTESDLDAMRAVKQVFDPANLLNPGKLYPHHPVPTTTIPAPHRESGTRHLEEPGTEGAELSLRAIPTAVEPQRNPEGIGIGRRGNPNITQPEIISLLTAVVGPGKVHAGSPEYAVDGILPQFVVFPTETDHVAGVLRVANAAGIPVVPFGGGTHLSSGAPITASGIVICLTRLNRITDLDTGNASITVGAGVTNQELQDYLRPHGLFFPVETASPETSTVGGLIALNAAGPSRLAYGPCRDLVLGLTVVTPTGEVIHAGGRTIKNVAGLDFCRLFTGSLGTLGVITGATLRLYHLPRRSSTVCLTFADINAALDASTRLLDSNLSFSAVELVDSAAAHHLSLPADVKLDPGGSALLLRIEGDSASVDYQLAETRRLVRPASARIAMLEVAPAATLWRSYLGLAASFVSQRPDRIVMKISVPRQPLRETCEAVSRLSARHGAAAGITAHCGNGIVRLFLDHSAAGTTPLLLDINQAVAALGGLVIVELGSLAVRASLTRSSQSEIHDLVVRLKRAFDPNDILSPGRLP